MKVHFEFKVQGQEDEGLCGYYHKGNVTGDKKKVTCKLCKKLLEEKKRV